MSRDWAARLPAADLIAARAAFEASGLASPVRRVDLPGGRGEGFRQLGWAGELAEGATFMAIHRLVATSLRDKSQSGAAYVRLFAGLGWSALEPLGAGASLVEIACARNRPDILAAVAESGVDLWSAPVDEQGLVLVARAAFHGSLECVKILASRAKPSDQVAMGAALLSAAHQGNIDCVAELINPDSAHVKDPHGFTVLGVLCKVADPLGLDEFAHVLSVSDPQAISQGGWTPLVCALNLRGRKASLDAWAWPEHPSASLQALAPRRDAPLERYALVASRSNLSQRVNGMLPEEWARKLDPGSEAGDWLQSMRESQELGESCALGERLGSRARL